LTAFAAAVDALFADPNLARDAIYRAAGADPGTPVRVIVRRPDRVGDFGDTRITSETATFDVRASEIAEPAAGDTLDLAGVTYGVQGTPVRDAERLIWTVEARPA
jgi:hypothetical protein